MSKTLLQKNTRFLLTWLPVVLLACSVLFYVMLRLQAHHMQEKQLFLKQKNVWNAFTEKSGNMERHITGEYDIAEANAGFPAVLDQPKDTSVYYPGEKKTFPFEMLTSSLRWNNKSYFVTTYVSSREIAHLITKVFIAEALVLLLLLIAIVVLNRKSSGLLWKPFFSTMKKTSEYDISRNQSLGLPQQTGIAEFDELNKVLTKLVDNVNLAYHNQKQFVENASHEMQTPLAIIRSKLELLINQPNLTEKSASLLGDITEANDRISQMNRTLLLLAKIENNQFPHTEAVNISKLIQQFINNLKNHADHFPTLTLDIADEVLLPVNRSLIEVLISNLVNNAVVHNIEGGKISIVLGKNQLVIENTGPPLQIAPADLFERFKKGSYQTKTTGLGLALVKQICLLYHYKISYAYQDGLHTLKVIFT